jgi:hypothetical protein
VIEPDETEVIEAVELVPTPSFGNPGDVTEGMGALFHVACFDVNDPRYRRV